MMKRMTIFLTAATLALVPMMSSAKGGPKERPATPDRLMIDSSEVICNCSVSGEPTQEDGVWVTEITCDAKWRDVIGELLEGPTGEPIGDVEPYDLATYGASFDVDLLDEATEDAQVVTLVAELEGDWSALCSDGICEVPPTPFSLTNFDGTQNIEVYAAVKAFYNGKAGSKPRNFEKTRSALACYSSMPTEVTE